MPAECSTTWAYPANSWRTFLLNTLPKSPGRRIGSRGFLAGQRQLARA